MGQSQEAPLSLPSPAGGPRPWSQQLPTVCTVGLGAGVLGHFKLQKTQLLCFLPSSLRGLVLAAEIGGPSRLPQVASCLSC